MREVQDEEFAPGKEMSTPVRFSEKAPEAGRGIVYSYKETPAGRLVVKVRFPEDWKQTDARPCMVFFHGGGWRSGPTDEVPAQFEMCCDHLASRGLVTANAQYRGIDANRKGAEFCVEDARSAIRWLRGRAAELGIDPDRLIASGGSAGGHLAAAVYTTQGYDAPGEDLSISCRPNFLVLFNPVLDMNTEKRKGLFRTPEASRACSPIHHLDEGMPAAILMYGTKDAILEDGKRYLESAKALGLTAELWTAEGEKHAFFNREPWKSKTIQLTERFLEKHGYLSGPPTIETRSDVVMELMDSSPE